MIHYHGLPITPATAAAKVLTGRHAFVSYLYPEQLGIAIEVCQSFAVDNGAFSAWRSGRQMNWPDYFEWVEQIKRLPGFDFAVIPDVIDGDELANNELVDAWPHEPWLSAPVWHMHESILRLQTLARNWPRVCIGSSGEFSIVGSAAWWNRINEAMNAICNEHGHPICKLHGLRMLNPDVFTRLPFASADSTNIAQNIGIDSAWRGTYQPPDKDWRAMIMAERIEANNSAPRWSESMVQTSICWDDRAVAGTKLKEAAS